MIFAALLGDFLKASLKIFIQFTLFYFRIFSICFITRKYLFDLNVFFRFIDTKLYIIYEKK